MGHSKSSNNHFLINDRLTKMDTFITVKTIVIASDLAYQFVEELFYLYGLPIDIVSDEN